MNSFVSLLRHKKLLLTAIILATTISVRGAGVSDPLVEPGPGALANALAQIAALQAEARALAPAQQKIATPLLDALREFRGAAPRAYAPKLRSNHKLQPGGRILVDIRGRVSDSLLAHLRAQGANIHNSHPQYESIRAEIPIAALEIIAAHADVKFIRPAELPVANAGTTTSEGFYAERVGVAQTAFGVTGAGVKVGVLSDSVRYGATSQSYGDLGGVTVLPGQSGISTNGDKGEGTAMLEIVHDLVPDSQLYFATGYGSQASMASNIIALADAGCDVIIDDLTYDAESPFHANQPISQAVQTVSDRGVLYFSSAANSGNLTHGTSGTWTGNFSTFGFDPTKGQLHNWGGTAFNQITAQDGAVNLFWSDPMGGSTNNYNLFITDSNGNILRQSITVQNGSNNPYESVAASTNSGEYVVVALASGAQRDIYVNTGRGRLAHGTSGNTRGHNAAPAANAFSVAATTAHGIGPGFHFSGGTNDPVEDFSSDGNPRLFFETDGSAVTPGNFLASGGRVLLKPDFTAADGTIASTNTFPTNVVAFTPFYGTSAAAPHAGAIAALIKSYRPGLTAAQIRTAMSSTALDIEAPGFDLNAGAGIVMADAALNSVDNTPPLVAVTSPGNGSAISLLASISGTASDVGGGLENSQIHFTLFQNGNFWSGTYWTNTLSTDPSVSLTASVNSGIWTYTNIPTGGNQVQGTYFISAFARDNAGNLSTPQSGVTSTSFTIDRSPPNVAITFPLNGSTLTNQPAGNWVQGTASDSPGNNLALTLFIRRNSDNLYWTGSGWGNVTNGFISNTYNAGGGTWQSTGSLPVPGSTLANGDYHFIAIAVDAAGNTQQVDSVVTVEFHPVYTFTAGSYGDANPLNDNMSWNNPANWDSGQVPTPDVIAAIYGYTPDATSLGSFSLYGLNMSGGTLTTVGMTIQKLNLSGGSLAGGAFNFPTNGVFNWSGGYLSGACTIPNGATLTFSGAADKLFSFLTLTNNGRIVWTGSGSLNATYNSVLQNNGTFSIQGDARFSNYTGGSPVPAFNNNGLLQKTNSAGTTVFSADNGGWIFNNNGTRFDIASGVFSIQNPFYVNAGSTFTGAGVTRVDASTVFFNGTNILQSGATFELAGGTVIGTNTFTGAGTFGWTGGTFNAIFNLQSNIAFNISGANNKTFSALAAINTAGTATWTGAGIVYMGYGSVLNNSGSFTTKSDSMFYNNTGGSPLPLFNNTGSFTKTNGAGTTAFDPSNGGVAFNNNGSVNVQSGVLTLGGGGADQNATFAIASASRMDLNGGAHTFGQQLNFNGTGLTRLTAGALTFSNGTNTFNNGGAFELAAGTVSGTNTFAGTGAFNWTGGNIAAILNLQPNIALNISGAADKTFAPFGTINTAGIGTWTGAGTVYAGYGSVLNNTGSFTVQNDSPFYNNTGGSPLPLFINNGSFTKTNSTGITTFKSDNGGVAFNNNGTVNIQSGTLALGGGGTSVNETFATAAGSLVDFFAGGFFFNGSATLAGAGTNRISGASATFNIGTNILGGGTFEVASGLVAGTNTFAGVGKFNWTGGTISAVITLQSTIGLNISGAADKTFAPFGTINSAGIGTWTGVGIVYAGYGSVLNNTGSFTVQNDSMYYNNTGGSPVPVFINNGSFTKTNSAGVTTFRSNNNGVAFNNNGTINVQAGDLQLGGGGTGTNGIFTVASGSHIDLTALNFALWGNLVFNGAGVTRANAGGVAFGGGTNTINGTFEISGGTVSGVGTFNGPGTFNWTAGTIAAVFNLRSNLTFNLPVGEVTLAPFGTLNNAGTMTWSGSGNINMGYGSAINNSGTFTVQNDGAFFNNTGGAPTPVVNNSGTFRKNTATGVTTFHPSNGGVNFTNTGTADLQTGNVLIWAGYATSPSARLQIPIGGMTANTQFGTETFNTPATFDGTLAISLVNGFTPTNGQSFTLVSYGSRTGQFATTQFPPLPVQSKWNLVYTPNSVLLQVVPSAYFQTFSLTNGAFRFSFTGQTGSLCLIEASTNLFNWNPLLTNTPFAGSLNFVDPQTTQFSKRFYRATIFP